MRRRTIGEFLSGYLRRLEGADDQRIRVDSDTSDNKGNVIVQPVLMLGKDTNDDIRPAKMDTQGRLDVVGFVPTQQPQAFLAQSNPVSGFRYEVLPLTKNVRVVHMAAQASWTVQPSPLELFMTVDGEIFRFFRNNPGNNTWYFPIYQAFASHENGILTTTGPYNERAFLIEGSEVEISLELTGGTATNIRSRVTWAKW